MDGLVCLSGLAGEGGWSHWGSLVRKCESVVQRVSSGSLAVWPPSYCSPLGLWFSRDFSFNSRV
jgi:hypothetical protein